MLDEILLIIQQLQQHITTIYSGINGMIVRIDNDVKILNKWFADVKTAFELRDSKIKEAFEGRDGQILEIVKQLNQRIERLEMLASDKVVKEIERPPKLKQVGNS